MQISCTFMLSKIYSIYLHFQPFNIYFYIHIYRTRFYFKSVLVQLTFEKNYIVQQTSFSIPNFFHLYYSKQFHRKIYSFTRFITHGYVDKYRDLKIVAPIHSKMISLTRDPIRNFPLQQLFPNYRNYSNYFLLQ